MLPSFSFNDMYPFPSCAATANSFVDSVPNHDRCRLKRNQHRLSLACRLVCCRKKLVPNRSIRRQKYRTNSEPRTACVIQSSRSQPGDQQRWSTTCQTYVRQHTGNKSESARQNRERFSIYGRGSKRDICCMRYNDDFYPDRKLSDRKLLCACS